MSAKIDKARDLKNRKEKEWLNLPGVVAVGIGLLEEGEPGIIISVDGEPKSLSEKIPKEVNGVPISIQKSGSFNAH